MSDPIWFQVKKKPSQYEGMKGDIQPPLWNPDKPKGFPAIKPSNKYAPGPVGKIPDPIFFQQQRIVNEKKVQNRRSFYIGLLLFISLIFSSATLLFQWGSNSYHFVSANANQGQEHLMPLLWHCRREMAQG